MTTVIIIAIIYGIYRLCKSAADRAQTDRAERERQRIREEQSAIHEQIRMDRERAKAETHRQIEAEKARIAWQKRQDAINRQAQAERERLRKEQERQAKEQERQAAQIAKHEEMIRKLEMRMATAESELAFNREQRDRLFLLLDIEERERDAAIPESNTWQKHQRKVISLENQIHTVQKRIDKAHMDKAFCESKLSA